MSQQSPTEEPPSKSARKRAAHEAQRLGERLIGMKPDELRSLDLPEALLEALLDAQRITGRGGLTRQRQLIGKLMRKVDTAPIAAALGARRELDAAEGEQFKRIEAWRERLLREGDAALDALIEWHPTLDRPKFAALVARAGPASGDSAQRTAAARALFRELRSLFDAGARTP